jgi:hypothetical protein
MGPKEWQASKQSKVKTKGAIARDPRPLAWGEPRLRAHPTHYLAHTPLPQRMEGGGVSAFLPKEWRLSCLAMALALSNTRRGWANAPRWGARQR